MRCFVVLALACAACTKPSPPPKAAAAPPVPVSEPAPPDDEASDAPSWIGVRFDSGSTRVIQVVPGAPADKAGVKIGDRVTSIEGHAVFLDVEAVQTIRNHPPGKTPFVVQRDGKDLAISIGIARMPDVDDLPKQTLLDKPAPGFTAQLITGSYEPSLKDLAGNVVVVDFWATWCGPCNVTLPYLDQWQTTYGPRGLRIVGLTAEDEDTVKEFLVETPLHYTIARDAEDRIGQQYLRFAVPMLVVIDRKGIVRHVQVGIDRFDAVETAIAKLL